MRRCLTLISLICCLAAHARVQADIHIVRDVSYVERDRVSLAADLYLPTGAGPHPGVLMVHGGAWMAGHKSHSAWHARRLAVAGFAAVAIDYRLAPAHKFPAQIEDCRAALNWLMERGAEYGIDINRLGAFGYSAGGHLVCLLAVRSAPQVADDPQRPDRVLKAIVAGGAPCDFRTEPSQSVKLAFWLGGTRAQVPDQYRDASPLAYVSASAPPMLFFHGTDDRVVSHENSLSMRRELRAVGVESEVLLIPQAGHLGAYMDRSAFARSVDFLGIHLGLSVERE
jgi:acetyl esterase/lipase